MNNSITNNINNKIDNQRLNKMISNNYNRNIIYKPKMAFINVNNFYLQSLNPITHRKTIVNNKNPCHNFEYIKYATISSNKKINDNIYNSFNNSRKLYKNKIQRKNYDNNNDNINNKEYYSVSIDKINKKFENKKVTCI